MKTVLIVDADLGFAYWLGQGLDEAGYQAFPAKNIADAAALPDELKPTVDLLIVNPALPGAGEFIETLRRWNPSAQVVALRGGAAHSVAGVDLWCRKPDRMDHFQRKRWIERVEQLLPLNLFSNKPAGAVLGNRVPFELVSGWLWERLAGIPRDAAPASIAPPDASSTDPASAAAASVPSWREWEGLTVDGRFALQRHLGGTEQSAVFLADSRGMGNTAIKLVLDPEDSDALLARWDQMASLTHPGLVRVFGMGRCRFGGTHLAYLVMEYAEENLGEVLQQRPLTTAEAREMLEPVLETLQFVHERGFVHGGLKPSNILAIENHVKLASDGLRPAGQPGGGRTAGVYDPPESAAGVLSPAADVWSLGVTLVEALTLKTPVPRNPKQNLVRVPEALPPSFRPIALPCLRLDPEQRGTIGELVSRLRATEAPQPQTAPHGRWSAATYAAAVAALAVGLSALLVGAHRGHELPAPATPRPVAQPASRPALQPAVPPVSLPLVPAQPILKQVLPQVSDSALETVRGTLTVGVRVDVDAAGGISKAILAAPGPSPYFAGHALHAAEQWKFAPRVGPEADRASEWIVQFAYTRQGTTAEARPAGN